MMTKSKAVLYMISSFGHGIGGHYYSLKTTADAVSEFANVYIISIGTVSCPLFSGLNNYYSLISNRPSLKHIIALCRFIDKYSIDVIHSFDEHIYLFARILSLIKGCGILHTKCGGIMPGRFFPYLDNIVVYSKEDENYFSKKNKFKNTSVHYIPNRVLKIKEDHDAVKTLKNQINNRGLIFLRISRFSGLHEKSILASVELIRRLNELGKQVQLVLIGVVQEKEVYEKIRSVSPENVYFETRPEFTVNATRLIALADVVIGTGRGAMEAIVHGKLLLSPAKNSEIPVLVLPEDVERFLSYNFSERTIIDECDLQSNYKKLADILECKLSLYNYKIKMDDISKKYFEISPFVLVKYKNLYDSLSPARFKFIDIIMHYMKVYRFFNINYKKDRLI